VRAINASSGDIVPQILLWKKEGRSIVDTAVVVDALIDKKGG
jgi:hypothetical protein